MATTEPAAPGEAEPTRVTASRGLVEWLAVHAVSLALTSYQTGQLILLGALPDGRLSVHERNFMRAMGLAAAPGRLHLATIAQIWRLENVLNAGQRANQHFDRLYVPRQAHTTGDLDIHELAVDGRGRILFVNTKYSCLATVSETHSFAPVWKPGFISRLAPEDRCHLNGLALEEGQARYVTAAGTSDSVDGWRASRAEGGVLIDLAGDRVLVEGLSMPHSPRLSGGQLWLLDSGRGELQRTDRTTGKRDSVAFCPGFLRGLSFHRHFAAVGSSLPRDGTFKGLPLDETIRGKGAAARCGVFVIDTRNGDILHWIAFEGLVRELFDVAILPGVRTPMCVGLASPEMRTLVTFEEAEAAP